MSLPPELHPDAVRAEIAAAEKRATLEAKRKRRKWILIGAFAGAIIVAGLGVVLVLLFQAVGQVKAQGKTIADQTATITKQTKSIQDLQAAQTENSANGRALVQKVIDLTTLIVSFTDPNSQTSKDQLARTAGIVRSLLTGQQALNQDVLRKLGEMAVALGAPPDKIAQILAQPSAPIVVPPLTTPTPSGPTSTPTPKPGVSPTPKPGVSPAVNLQVQCPVVCPK